MRYSESVMIRGHFRLKLALIAGRLWRGSCSAGEEAATGLSMHVECIVKQIAME